MQQYADIYLLQSDFAVKNVCILLHLVGFLLTLLTYSMVQSPS